jgi:hypothetical protein
MLCGGGWKNGKIIKIGVKNSDEVGEVLKLDLDVWGVEKDHLIAKATKGQIKKLEKREFPVSILYATEKEYEEAVESGQIAPMRRDREKYRVVLIYVEHPEYLKPLNISELKDLDLEILGIRTKG